MGAYCLFLHLFYFSLSLFFSVSSCLTISPLRLLSTPFFLPSLSSSLPFFRWCLWGWEGRGSGKGWRRRVLIREASGQMLVSCVNDIYLVDSGGEPQRPSGLLRSDDGHNRPC